LAQADDRVTDLPLYVDELVVGASPLLLLHASRQASRGRSVLLIDRSPEYGGAWSCGSWDALTNVELGSHYLYCDRPAYDVLSEAGVDLVPMKPVPYFWRRRRLPIWRSHKVIPLRKALVQRMPGEFLKELKRSATYGRFYYPRTGAAGLVEALVANAAAACVMLRAGASCTAVEVDADEVRCEVNGRTVRTARLVTGESFDLASLTVDGRPFPFEARIERRIHRLMRVSSDSCEPLTYVEVHKHPLLKRVSLAHRPAGSDTVLCVQPARQATVDECRNALAELRIVTSDCTVMASTITEYEQVNRPTAVNRRLHRRTRRVRILPTQNCLGDSLVWYLSGSGRRLLADVESVPRLQSAGR
jgi:hypothetical protein